MEISDLEKFDIVWFEGRTGFAIDLKTEVFVAFTNPPKGLAQANKWEHETFPIANLRDVVSKVGVPTEMFVSGGYGGGVSGGISHASEILGVGMRNKIERSKASKRNGLEFSLRSTQMPKFFSQISDDGKRAQLFEAVRQIFETRTVDARIHRLPDEVRSSFYKPSKEEIQQKEITSQSRQQNVQKYLAIGCFGIVGLVAVFGLWSWISSTTYRNAALNGDDMSQSGILKCAMLSFGHSLIPTRANSIVLTTFVAESDDEKVGLYPSYEFERGSFVDGPREENGQIFYGGINKWGFIDIDEQELANFRIAETPSCG